MTPIEIALKEYGTHEVEGVENNPKIVDYFHKVGETWVSNDETGWCTAFINWVLKKAGKPHTSSLLARSFLKYGTPTNKPELGDIVVLWRSYKNSPYGHVGFFISENKSDIYILGGNQSDAVNIQAYEKTRLLEYRKIPLTENCVV